MTPELPLADPAALNATTPRTLRVRLLAEPKRFDISGKMVWGESYDGHYVGPTLHLVPGEHVELTLVNRLTTPTNLHFHGLNVSPSGSAHNPGRGPSTSRPPRDGTSWSRPPPAPAAPG